MSNKNMPLREYKRWISKHNWTLEKSGAGDYKLKDANGKTRVPFVKVTHPGSPEVVPHSIKKTKEALKGAGLE